MMIILYIIEHHVTNLVYQYNNGRYSDYYYIDKPDFRDYNSEDYYDGVWFFCMRIRIVSKRISFEYY